MRKRPTNEFYSTNEGTAAARALSAPSSYANIPLDAPCGLHKITTVAGKVTY
jgi:hypothetical protein